MAGKLQKKLDKYKCKKCKFTCRLNNTLVNHRCSNLNIMNKIQR